MTPPLHHSTTPSPAPTRLTRRTFLRAAGVALALPMLEALLPRSARAAAAAANRKRMVLINTSLGLHAPLLFPALAGKDYTLTPYLESLAALRNDFTICSGLSHPEVAGGHVADYSFLTAAPHPGNAGFRNTISVDQFAAERIGAETRLRSLTLHTGGSRGLSYTRAGVPIPSEASPSKVFTKLFLDGTPAQVAAQVQRLRDGRSVMDKVAAEAKRLSRAMDARDRDKLDEYFTSVREVEQRLVQSESWEQKPKPKVAVPPPQDIADTADIIGRSRLMYDVIQLALQTDSTRLVTFNIEGIPSVPPIEGVTEGHHNLSHHGQDPAKIAQLRLIEQAEMQALGAFLTKLKATPEEGGALLDNTMVFFGSNLGNASSHDNRNLPVILAGGGFRHGQHLAFDRTNNAPLSDVFVTMLQRFGIETDKFGSSRGTLSALTTG